MMLQRQPLSAASGKVKPSVENQIDVVEDGDDPFKAFKGDLTKLRKSNPDVLSEE